MHKEDNINPMLKEAVSLFTKEHHYNAAILCNRIIQTAPNTAIALDILGAICIRIKQFTMAEDYFKRAISIDDNNSMFHTHLAIALQEQQLYDVAIKAYDKAIEYNAKNFEALFNKGYLLQQMNKPALAIPWYEKALAVKGQNAIYHNKIGTCFLSIGSFEKAKTHMEKAHNLDKANIGFLQNLADCYRYLGESSKAKTCIQVILQQQPNHIHALDLLGKIASYQQDYTTANQIFTRIKQLVPDNARIHYHHSLSLLAQGDFRNGWQEFEWRLRLPEMGYIHQNYHQPRWDGSALKGKTILLYTEQGFGDALQFLRYAQKLLPNKIIIQTSHFLKRLFENQSWIEKVILFGDPLPDFDTHTTLLSLPYLLQLVQRPLAQEKSYIQADSLLIKKWQPYIKDPSQFNIGMVWCGNKAKRIDKYVFSDVQHFLPLADIPGITLYSLQKGHGKSDMATISHENVYNFVDEITDFADTAAIIENLDLVITIDTAVAHLAGTMGKKVWIILTTTADWRWKECNQPLYRSQTLFRQDVRGDWGSVFKKIKTALHSELHRAQLT